MGRNEDASRTQRDTPGCVDRGSPDGAHSDYPSGRKRARTLCEAKAALDAHGQTGYGGICKVGQREMFAQVVMKRSLPALYLDGPDAALTLHLLKNKVPAARLMPVNKSKAAARQIERACPGVVCVVGDICSVAAAAEPLTFGAVWYDMCGVGFGPYAVSDLVDRAEDQFFTLSCSEVSVMKFVFVGIRGVSIITFSTLNKSEVMVAWSEHVDRTNVC